MLEKPRLADDKIIACLKTSYGLTVTELQFLPLGYDMDAGVYRVQADRQTYFLKVKRGGVNERSILIPRYLKQQGIEAVVAPLPAIADQPWGMVDDFNLILYPFIEGQSGMEIGLTDGQWMAFGRFLDQLHNTTLTPDLFSIMPQETFIPNPRWSAAFRQLQAAVGSRAYHHPAEQQLVAFWQDHHNDIVVVLERAEQIGQRLRATSPELVLCHADIHTANLLVDSQGKLFVVDWDDVILAPKERDLMFALVGDFVTDPREEALFFQGYGTTDIDRLTLAYYRHERVMEDIASFGERVLAADASDETKQDSLTWFLAQFRPGGAVDMAHRLDDVLPL